jgi:hypothetical protein
MARRADTDDQQVFYHSDKTRLITYIYPRHPRHQKPGPEQQQWVTVCGAAKTEQHGNGRKKNS